MNWYKKSQVYPFGDASRSPLEGAGLDYNRALDQLYDAFIDSNVHPDPDFSPSHAVVDDARSVVGGSFEGWEQSDEAGPDGQPVMAYKFDIAIRPESRGNPRRLVELINKNLESFERQRKRYEDAGYATKVQVLVINERLVPLLERRFGFRTVASGNETGYYPWSLMERL